MAGQLEGKVALVTGAATGIGAACSRALAREGAVVACASLPTDPTQAVVDEHHRLRRQGGQQAAQRHRSRVVPEGRRGGRRASWAALHILLNNAGITDDGLFMRMKPESWRKVLSVNLDGAFNVTQPAVKIMVQAEGGADHQHLLGGRPDGQRRARPTTRPPRPASSASPSRWPGSSAAATSRSTPSPPATSRPR